MRSQTPYLNTNRGERRGGEREAGWRLLQSQAPYQLGHRPAAAKRSPILATASSGPTGETAGRVGGTFPQIFPQLGISSLATMESVPSTAPKPEQLLAIARAYLPVPRRTCQLNSDPEIAA